MISDNPTYIFDKLKTKIKAIQEHLGNAEDLCDFALARKEPMSGGTYSGLSQDALASLKKAADLLDDSVLICNRNISG